MKQSLLTTMYFGVIVLGILGASALLTPYPPTSKFSFKFMFHEFIRKAECNICFGEDCVIFEEPQCKYYVETEDIVEAHDDSSGSQNPRLQKEVDSMIYDITEKAEQIPDQLECIPYISRYTECTKENACLGCQTCHCNEDGTWNCSISYCHSHHPILDIDHKVLVKVIEILKEFSEYNRHKREATGIPIENANVNTLSLEEISELLFGVPEREQEQENHQPKRANKVNHVRVTTESDDMRSVNYDSRSITETVTNPQSETITTPLNFRALDPVTTSPYYIAFDEVLNDVNIDTKPRRKHLLDIVNNTTHVDNATNFDYLLIDEDKDNASRMSFVFDLSDDSQVTERPQDEVTKIVIDLLETARKESILNETDYIDLTANKGNLVGVGFDNTNAIVENDTVNIMKRDVFKVSEMTKDHNVNNMTGLKIFKIIDIANETDKQGKNITLKDHILLPLVKFINSKRNELDDLKKIKDNLISFMTNNNQSPVIEIIDYPNISDSNILHDLEMFPDLLNDFRRHNPVVLQKFLMKLKADIYEVLKDILGIQRYHQGHVSDELNLLIQSLKRYVNKNKMHKKKLKTKKKQFMMFRRLLNLTGSKCKELSFKQCVIEVIRTVDEDMPISNNLASLSGAAKRIIRHIVENYYKIDSTSLEFQAQDPNYSMMNDLHAIGSKWQEMSSKVLDTSLVGTHYIIKLLHILVEKNIEKIDKALTLINFKQNRRMIPYLKKVDSTVIDGIDDGLNSVQNQIQIMVQYTSKNPRQNTIKHLLDTNFKVHDDIKKALESNTEVTSLHKHKKISFIKHIRNILKSSKNEEYLDKHVPKSEIVKQLARKRLDELAQKRLNEYEEIMKKWQRNLGVQTRLKRHTQDSLLGRIKNIIPKYLRHKVHPKLQNKKSAIHKAKNKTGKKKKNHGGHKKNKKTTHTTGKITSTKTTTKYIKGSTKSYKTIGTTIRTTDKKTAVPKETYTIHQTKSTPIK